MTHWEAVKTRDARDNYTVGLYDDEGELIRVLPIKYSFQAEAERGAATLNRRDANPEDLTVDARYAREVDEWHQMGCPPDRIPILRLDPNQPAPDLDPEGNFG